MLRPWLVPCLVAAVFLSGCKSAQQAAPDPTAPVLDRVEDAWGNAYQNCADWLDAHPTARGVVYVAGFVALVAAVATVVVLYVLVENQDGH